MQNLKVEGRKLMIKNITSVLLVLACFVLSAMQLAKAEYATHVGLEARTNVIEAVSSLRIVLDDKTLTGFVEVEICNYGCVETRLVITPETVASQNGQLVPLKMAKTRLGREVGIVYEVSSNTVTKISW